MSAISPQQIAEFLHQHFDKNSSGVTFIGAGMFSQAYAFHTPTGDFVMRLNRDDEDFQKDRYAYSHFAGPGLPIPEPLLVGRFDRETCFCITKRCPGRTLNEWDGAILNRLTLPLFAALQTIHRIDVTQQAGWGLLDTQGVGLFASWPDYLRSFYNQKFSFAWETLFETTFMERDLAEQLRQQMEALLPFCPIEKYLVHGDFGFDNVISDGQAITAVLDWAEMRYGDFVYDVAYLEYWSDEIRYGDLFRTYWAEQNQSLPNFAERMSCYLLHIGLGSLVIAAIHHNEPAYQRVKARTWAALQQTGGSLAES